MVLEAVVGRFYMAISAFCFASVGALIKVLGTRVSALEKVFWRSVLSMLVTVLMNPAAVFRGPPPKHWKLLLVRGACGHFALCCFFFAASSLPIAQANLLGKVHPVAAATFAAIFLGEQLQLRHLVGSCLCLCGLMAIADISPTLMARELSERSRAVVCAVGSGVLSGAAYCTVRALRRRDEPQHWIILVFPCFSLVALCNGGYLSHGLQSFDTEIWVLLCLVALMTQGGQVFLVKGMSRLSCADATLTMFLGSVFGVLLGWVLGEGVPPLSTWFGGMLVLAGCSLVGEAHLPGESKPKPA